MACRLFYHKWSNVKGGTVINMSSLAGKKTFVNHAAYVASKFGVHGLSETVRELDIAATNQNA